MIKKILYILILNYQLFSLDLNLNMINSGDIIFRKENSFLSDIFSNIDSFEYSHVGIILKENNHFYVYHIERSSSKEKDLKKEEISKFLIQSEKYSIIRLREKISEDKLLEILKDYENMKTLNFDMHFILNNGVDNLYCSEFINEIYKNLINKDIYLYLYEIMGEKGITLKSIYMNKEMFEKIL